MIAAIERFVLNYLYKYDSISIDIERIIDISEDDLRNHLAKLSDTIQKEFDRILPIFEQDHEVILVEIDRNLVKIHGKVIITFKSILAVYPLTEIGRQLLNGKLNDDFKISLPKFDQVIEKIKIERSLKNRQNAAKRIFSVFEIKEFPNPYFVKEVKQVITSILSKDNSAKKSFLYHLITYDKTPSFLPHGNAEFFAKVGLIALNSKGYDEQVFKNGPFYKACITYKGILNTNTALSGLKKYFELPDEVLKSSHKKMVELISENHKGLEIFKIAYFFLALKSYLLKNDNNLVLIYNNIIEELEQDKTTALHVLYLIAYTFSFEQLYEGLHILDRAPLLERKYLKSKTIVKEYEKTILTNDYDIEKAINFELVKEETISKELSNIETKTSIEPETQEIELESKSNIEITPDDKVEQKSSTVNEPAVIYPEVSTNQNIEESQGKKISEFKIWVIKAAPNAKKKDWEKFFETKFTNEFITLTIDQLADALNEIPNHEKLLFSPKFKKSDLKKFFN
jgi:hypothetical protein